MNIILKDARELLRAKLLQKIREHERGAGLGHRNTGQQGHANSAANSAANSSAGSSGVGVGRGPATVAASGGGGRPAEHASSKKKGQ